MIQYRCTYPHPDFPEKPCNALLLKGEFAGQIAIRCSRCRKDNLLYGAGSYTVDRALVAG